MEQPIDIIVIVIKLIPFSFNYFLGNIISIPFIS